jgi:hypothetical protein
MFRGAIAQLGERLHGMQEVGGSIPPSSTNDNNKRVILSLMLVWRGSSKYPGPHRLEA